MNSDTGGTTPSTWRDVIVAILASAMVVACILWNLDLPIRLGLPILKQQYMAFELGLALALAFLRSDFRGHDKAGIGLVGGLISLVVLATLFYTAWEFAWLLREQSYRPWQITVVGAVVVLAVMEGVRRRVGWTLFAIVGVFLVYALFADQIPGPLIGKALSPERLVQYVGFDPNAVFSTPLAVGTIIVLLFVFFGQLLFAAGGGTFFTDLAMALTGRTRGGSAKIAVLGSALFGSISGSAVSNVVTTGVVTIPLMKRGGYSKRDAGAIEAVASTGGQLMPPIMGAAAFLMAEFLNISYFTVAAAALLPAVLYYLSVFVQVDLLAGRDRISAADADTPTAREVLREGWHFVFPFGLLLAGLFWWQLDPEEAALMASAAVAAVGFLRGYRGSRLDLRQLGAVFVETGVGMVNLILIVAAAGFVIGVLNITGLGFALTLMLVNMVGSNAILLLLISAVICIFLGMGMPTSGVYVLLAALVAPSLVQAGITPIAANLFILYFGMMSMITPPVALAAFAAATISDDDPLATGVAAVRVGWAAFVIPFIFVASPGLLMTGGRLEIAVAFCVSAIGIIAVTAGIVGFWSRRLGPLARGAFVVSGALCLPMGFISQSSVPHVIAALAAATIAGAITFTYRTGSLERRKQA